MDPNKIWQYKQSPFWSRTK